MQRYIFLLILTLQFLFATDFLTQEEQAFLKQHPIIKVHNEQSWRPYNFNENGDATGYTIDVLNILAKKLNIDIQYVVGHTWSEYLNMLENKEIDIIGNMARTEQRSKYTRFTKNTIINEKPLIFTQKNNKKFFSLSDLKGHKVALVKGFWYEELLQKKYPDIQIVPVRQAHDTIDALLSGKADAIIGIQPVMSALLQKNNHKDIIAVAEAKFNNHAYFSLKIGVRDDYPLLVQALDKAFDRSYIEIQKIKSKWLEPYSLNDTSPHTTKRDILSPKEKEWIANNVINVGVESWSPVVFFNNETQSIDGFSGEIFKVIAQNFKLQVRYHNHLWDKLLEGFKNKQIDLLPDTYYTQERATFGLFTRPYFDIREFLYVKTQNNAIYSFDDLTNKKLAIIKDYGTIPKVKEKYPFVHIIETKDMEDSINKVLTGEVDAFLDTQIVVENYLADNFVVGVKGIPQNSFPPSSLHFFINQDKPILHSILQKGLDSIEHNKKSKIIAKWVTQVNNKKTLKTFIDAQDVTYLKKYTPLTMCIAPNWMPFEAFNDKKAHDGMGMDFKTLLEEKLNRSIQIVKTKNWTESLQKAQQKECDILSLAKKTPKRSEYLYFTDPIISVQYVIATKDDQFYIDDINNFQNKKFAVTKDYAVEEDITRAYPNIELVLVPSVQKGLEKVSDGVVFGYIGSAPSIAYAIQKNSLIDLKVTGQLSKSYDLSYGIRNDDPRLLEIFQKVVQGISEKDKSRIFKKWVAIKYEQVMDYSLIWQISLGGLVLLGLFGYWNIKIAEAKKIIEQQNKELEVLAATDKLTGIYNRTKLDELLANEIKRNERYQTPLSCAIFDIDHFKHTNDTFGHLAGDKALQEMTRLISENIRATDYFGRWGGEEFLLILPQTNCKGLEQLLEKIRTTIAKHEFSEIGTKTVSIGATMYQQGESDDSMIKRADDALYKAKESGRNKIVIA